MHGKELKIKGPGGTGYYCFGTDGRLLRNAVVAFPSDGRLSWFSGTGKRANSKTIYFYDPASASYKAVSVDEKGRIAYGGRNARAEKLSAFAAEHPDGVSPEALQLGGLSDIFAPEPGTFTSGWTDGGKKYIRDDGTYASGWCDIGKYRYYFDPATRIKTSGKLLNLGGSYYYFYPAGNMVRGKELGIKGPAGKGYYYFGTDGRLAKNAVVAFPSESRLSWYDRGGKRVSSRTIWLYSDGAASWIPVYTLADGNIKWDDRYVSAYVGLVDFSLTYPDGITPEEMKYEGLPAKIDCGRPLGWNEAGTRYYVTAKDGTVTYAAGFQTIEGKKYYFDPSNGMLAHGWRQIGKYTFYFNESSGVMASGEMLLLDGKLYYFYPAGNLFSGWLSYKGYKYYFDPKTREAAVSCVRTIDGKWCIFDSDGVLLKRGYHTTAGNPQVSVKTVALPSYATGTFSYVTRSRISVDATREECIETFIGRAYEYLGTDFVNTYALAPGKGIDCSGLVLQCLYACGIDMGIYNTYNHHFLAWQEYNSMNWWNNSVFCRVPLSERQRGDLIIYRNHIAIYLGDDMIIDSYPPSVKVRSYYSLVPIGCMRVFN